MADTNEIIKLLNDIIARYKPGGEFGKPEEALLKRAKTKSLAETGQALVSSGLGGTTIGAGAGRKWEEEVGMPSRLQLEDIRSQRLTGAMGAKAGYLERGQAATQAAYEAKQQRALQYELGRRPSMAERGLSVFGKPLHGSLAETQADALRRSGQIGTQTPGATMPGATTHTGDTGAFNMLGDFGQNDLKSSNIPTIEGYGPMFGDFGGTPSTTPSMPTVSTAAGAPQMSERQRQIQAIKDRAKSLGISYQDAIKLRYERQKETGSFEGF